MADVQARDSKVPAEAQDVHISGDDIDGGYFAEIDEGYLRSSWSTRFYRGVLFQMILFGA